MEYALINTIIASIVTAFLFGWVAKKLNLPAIFGFLLAGVAIGPNTPGFVADVVLAQQLAEIGILLLMFGVGLHFSFRDLIANYKIAVPGALAQMVSATLIGGFVAVYLGYPPVAALVFGFSLSVASTIVLLRTLEQRKQLESPGGTIAVSWLIVEDIAMVLALVMLPVLAEMRDGTQAASLTVITTTALAVLFKIGGFFAFMLLVGRRLLPWLLVSTAKLRSSEMNTLATLAIALGFASIAYLVFDASLALGAFLAGVMLNESAIGRKSAEHSLALRDTFSVLFFVSVGMLFDPRTLIDQPLAVLLTFLTIVLAKSGVAFGIAHWARKPYDTSVTIALGLAQIGEFSFILGGLALSKGLIEQDLYNLMLAGAMLSIVANPLLFRLYDNLVGQHHRSV
jgi:CPA2 family monovalent cation:H+ antiporter-2